MVQIGDRPSRNRIALLCLSLFVTGAILGRALGPDPAELPPSPPGAAAPAPAPAPPALAAAELAETLDLPDPGPVPRGTGTITGLVTTTDGAPVPDVTVRARPLSMNWNPDPSAGARAGDPRLGQAREGLRHAILARRGLREAVSGADGTFVLTRLGDGTYRLEAWRRGYRIRNVGGGARRAGDEARFLATPVVLVEVDVLLPDGTRADRARVEVRGVEHRWMRGRTWTRASHLVDCGPGPARFRAIAGEGRSLASEEVEFTPSEGEPPSKVVLRLRERTGILGRLTFPPQDDFRNFSYRIAVLRIREGGPADPERLRFEQHAECDLYTYSPRNGWGRFSLTDLPPGRYLVGVRSGGGEILASTEVVVTEGMATADLTVLPPAAGEAVTVKVLDRDGRPAERSDVQMQATFRGADGMGGRSGRVEYLGDGAFRVWRPRPHDGYATDGIYLLRVRSKTEGEFEFPYDPDGPAEIAVRLADPAGLAVLLPGYPGSRYEGAALVAVVPADDSRRGFPETKRPDARGRVEFGPLAPGDWIVRLQIEGRDSSRETVLEAPVSLRAGATSELTLAPPPLFDLVILNAPEGETYRLEPADGRRWRRAGGRFDRILAGDYLLWREQGGPAAAMTVRIAGDTTVRFAPESLTAFRVAIHDADGLLGRAGLEDGDLVVAIGGQEIVGTAEGAALLAGARDEGATWLTILRGGDRLTIPVDLAAARDPARAGGSLHPWPR